MVTGYHYQVTSWATAGTITSVTIKNNEIEPIYYDACPTVSGTGSDTSLKGLIAGQSRNFMINALPNSKGLTVECDRLVTEQEIQYDANLDGVVVTIKATLSLSEVATFAATGASKTTIVSYKVSWTATGNSSRTTATTTVALSSRNQSFKIVDTDNNLNINLTCRK